MSVIEAIRRTRFSPYMLLFLLAAVVVVAYVTLGASLLRQHQDQGDLSSQIDSAAAVLVSADDVRQDVEDLPARLAAARQELDAAQAALPSELDSNYIIQTVLALADENQVHVLSVDTIPPAAEEPTEELNADTSLSFDLEVEGDFGQLVAFLEALESGATSTTRVGTFALQEGDGRYALSLELVSYARSPIEEPSSPEDETQAGGEAEAISDGEEAPSE